MSSRSSTTPELRPSFRTIRPLPIRARNRSSQPGSSRNVSGPISLSHNPSIDPVDLLSTEPDNKFRRRSFHLDPSIDAVNHSLRPAKINVPSGQINSTLQPTGLQNIFTFRSLHNATPKPSPEPEGPLLSPQDIQAEPSYSSLPIVATHIFEGLQPQHLLYSDEKIVVNSDHGPPNSLTPVNQGPPETSDGLEADSNVPVLVVPRRELHQRSVSEVSIASNNDEIPIPYNVSNEPAPLKPYFTTTFQTALKTGINIACDTVGAIEKCVGASNSLPGLERLISDAKKLAAFQSCDNRTIAVLGDSGEGKSSLINALLHFPEIAKTGDIGSACTSVVTEYRQKLMAHTDPITIEVEYLASADVEELIKELLWNYRQILLPGVESDEVSAEDYARYQRESDQAWSALEAGFKHQPAFNKALISDMSEEGQQRATDQLIKWAHELDWPDGNDSGIWKSTASTAEECCQKTAVFMEDKFWPFTKIIRVYLSSQVLKTGVVLADLPGLQDTNLARVRATQKYLMKCDHVFIVAKISRAITDQSLKSSLYTIIKRHAPLEWEETAGQNFRIAVVCTKSEDINQTTARREFCGPGKVLPSGVMEQLDIDIDNAKRNKNRALKKQLKRRQVELVILLRVKLKFLQAGLPSHGSAEQPRGKGFARCICIKSSGATTRGILCLEHNIREIFEEGQFGTGHCQRIPDLRQFCHAITADARLLEAKHFLQSALSSLLNSAGIWANSSSDSQQADDSLLNLSIYEVLQNTKTEASSSIEKSHEDFRSTVKEVLLIFLEENRNSAWETAAIGMGYKWHGWHWTQYNAWCKNNGNHWTEKREHSNWNAELIWKMKMELGYQWDLLEEDIPTVLERLLDSTKHCLTNLQGAIRDRGLAPALIEGIEFRIRDMVYKFTLAQQEFAREFKIIRRYASEPNDSSYIVSEMIPAYRSAAHQSGKGKAERQKDIVQGRIANGTLFPQISGKILENIEDLSRKIFSGLDKTVTAVLDLIVHDVDMALIAGIESRTDGEHQADPEAARRKNELLVEVEELKKRHEGIVASIAVY